MGQEVQTEAPFSQQSIKSWLCEYRQRWTDIETQDEMLKRLQARMVSTSAGEITGMPHAGDSSSDKMAIMTAQKLEIDERLKKLIKMQNEQRATINSVLSHLRSADERAVISFRYLTDLSWNDVSMSMFGARDDYEERAESYLRRTTKTHGRALRHMAEAMSREKQ